MANYSFKPGDKVRIISNEAPIVENEYMVNASSNPDFKPTLLRLYDVVTIATCSHGCYTIKEDRGVFLWIDRWFESASHSKLNEFIDSLGGDVREK